MYWFFYDTSGAIQMCLQNEGTEWTNLNGYAGVISVADTDTIAQDASVHQKDYSVENGVLVKTVTDAQLLQQAQQAKIVQLEAAYAQTLASGFQCDIGGATYTFGWQQDATHNDQLHLSMVQQAIDKGVETFPVAYADINSNPVSIPDQTTLTALDTKATSFGWAQVKQLRSLIGQAKATTTVAAANAIQWTAASY